MEYAAWPFHGKAFSPRGGAHHRSAERCQHTREPEAPYGSAVGEAVWDRHGGCKGCTFGKHGDFFAVDIATAQGQIPVPDSTRPGLRDVDVMLPWVSAARMPGVLEASRPIDVMRTDAAPRSDRKGCLRV